MELDLYYALICTLLRRLNRIRQLEAEARRPHVWNGYACKCRFCGITALEARGSTGPCPNRR